MDGLHVGSCAASNRETELNHGEVNVKSLVKHLALILPLFPRPPSLALSVTAFFAFSPHLTVPFKTIRIAGANSFLFAIKDIWG